MSKFWNEEINSIKPYVAGEQPKDKNYVKLNTNENPYPPSCKVLEAMKNALDADLRLYPDPTCRNLIGAISKQYNINKDEVFVGNGSDEILSFAFKTFFSKSKKLLFPDISYSFYPVYAEFYNLDYEKIELDENFELDVNKFKRKNSNVIFPNPNAPTGKYVEREKIISLLENNKDGVVVVDEAYIDFGGKSMSEFIHKYKNLLVIMTFSKSRSLAGLRVGFALGDKELIEGLNRVKNSINSYTLDRIALKGAEEAINDSNYYKNLSLKIQNTRNKYTESLRELGFTVIESKSNFIFAKYKEMEGEYLYKKLKENGVLVRHFNDKRITDYLRITIGTDEEMDILLAKLKFIIN
ncbi:histidinol-phosphate transaminase [Clostridium sp. BJN0001]|uniref:histidinol-phosphate transaminase n=1 Tax=Clostridium sp. BJN0001 TaxID=2930219 RepID=UPI001FD5998B|nr:histidinol-phosphate transaminase [Clostridium sp. BJN0001]